MIRTILICLYILAPSCAYCLTAFPGAQGMGADSMGGRGGDVYIVDTTSDNPDDGVTFREAAEAVGRRYVVFEVSGIIDLNAPLEITSPYITIDASVEVSGTAADGDGTIASIVWSCPTCTPTNGNASPVDGAMDASSEDWTTGNLTLFTSFSQGLLDLKVDI